MSLLEIGLVALLATYRITAMLNSEEGPAHIFGRFRKRIGVTYDQYSNPVGNNWFADGILCFYCLSVWIGFAVTGLLGVAALVGYIEVAGVILLPFALSGGAVYLKKVAG